MWVNLNKYVFKKECLKNTMLKLEMYCSLTLDLIF